MPQPKPPSKSTAKGAAKPRAKAAAKPASGAAKPKPKATTAPKPASKAKRKPSAKATSPRADRPSEPEARPSLDSLRETLADGIVLTTQRLQETMDDAVSRGRLTRRDAEDLARGLLETGRRQSRLVLLDLEKVIGFSRSDVQDASAAASDRVLREVDRARRVVGVGPDFPVLAYDDLDVKQVRARLADLGDDDLRTVRAHEAAHRGRTTILKAIDRALAAE